jgi:hypothetical protein
VNIWLFFLQLSSTCVMVGIIWLVQLVHYPLMQWGDRDRFVALSQFNQSRTSWVVGGPMLLEAGCAAALLLNDDLLRHSWCYWLTVALLVSIWCSTAFFMMPLHRRLLEGFDSDTIDGLVRRNWFRTAAWSLRAVFLFWIGTTQGWIPVTVG